MARGGRGGGGGGSRGGGSRSSSRGGGGRPRSSSSRSRSSSSSSRSYSYGGSSYHHHHSHYSGGYGYSSSSSPAYLVATFIIVVILIALSGILSNSEPKMKNYVQREKLVTNNGFMTDCVTDNSDLFSNETAMESKLKHFHDKTGVQPVIISNTYNNNINSNDDAFNWAVDYYDNNIDREDCLVLVYFDAYDIDDEGYSALVTGHQVDSIMDSDAIEIFWGYFDRYWNSDATWDDMFVQTFNSTADTIMTVHKTTGDVVFIVVALFIAIIVGVVIVAVVIQKRKQAKEKAESDERILNADLSKSVTDDPLLQEYE